MPLFVRPLLHTPLLEWKPLPCSQQQTPPTFSQKQFLGQGAGVCAIDTNVKTASHSTCPTRKTSRLGVHGNFGCARGFEVVPSTVSLEGRTHSMALVTPPGMKRAQPWGDKKHKLKIPYAERGHLSAPKLRLRDGCFPPLSTLQITLFLELQPAFSRRT